MDMTQIIIDQQYTDRLLHSKLKILLKECYRCRVLQPIGRIINTEWAKNHF